MANTPSHALPGASVTHGRSISISTGNQWLIGTVVIVALLYYFIGVDEGAYSVFGKSMFIHEFVHDARHFLGFPCH
jgi:Probable cobalt transporter subunit (CbtB)